MERGQAASFSTRRELSMSTTEACNLSASMRNMLSTVLWCGKRPAGLLKQFTHQIRAGHLVAVNQLHDLADHFAVTLVHLPHGHADQGKIKRVATSMSWRSTFFMTMPT